MKNKILWLGKILLPVLLIAFFAFYLRHLIIRFEMVKNKAHLKVLNNRRPNTEAMDHLANVILGKEEGIKPHRLNEYFYYYNKVIEYMPFWAEAHHILGYLHTSAEDREKAVDSFKQSVEYNPHFIMPLFNLGVIYFNEGNYEKSLDYLNRAVTSKPNNNLKIITLSRFYREIWLHFDNPQDQSLQLVKDAYREAYKLIVIGYFKLGRYKEVLDKGRYAIYVDFGDKDFFYYYIGVASFHLKQYKEANAFLNHSVKLNANNAEAFYYLGLCYNAIGRKDLSRQALTRAALLRKQNSSMTVNGQDVKIRLL